MYCSVKKVFEVDINDKSIKFDNIDLKGWIRSFRSNRFIELNDGSSIKNLQCVIDYEKVDENILKKISVGISVHVKGNIVESLGKGQTIELLVSKIDILGECDMSIYPLQPKKHSLEFLRENAHLRIRTNLFGAIMRIRHSLSFAIHKYFNDRGFFYVNTPIITGSDAEGAGELFNVTKINPNNFIKNEVGEVDFSQDFFGKQTHLTVSGQLEGEAYALGLGKIYTFGPTFRAENSNTTRHLAEFWMVEPEIAFLDLIGNMDLAEDFLKYTIKYIVENNSDDLDFLNNRYIEEQNQKPKETRSKYSLLEKLYFILNNPFLRVSYTEAIEILKNSNHNRKGKFEKKIIDWGEDLQSEHERFLVENHFKSPIILFDYPADIKAFYMKLDSDEKTVRAMDILFPEIGEIIGGSQREDNLDILKKQIKKFNINEEELWWYLDLRKFGGCPHSGFGLGFERLVLFVTGMSNIRDVIPFPRTPKNANF